MDATHPDLNGVVVPGYSVIRWLQSRTDENGHGTWLAGIVAARTDNQQGIAGVGYDHVQVMPVKVLDANGLGQDSDIIKALSGPPTRRFRHPDGVQQPRLQRSPAGRDRLCMGT